jgi:hypothetical protein
MNSATPLTNEQFQQWMQMQQTMMQKDQSKNNQSNNKNSQSNQSNKKESNQSNNQTNNKKSVGDKVFTAEEIETLRKKRIEHAYHRYFNGQVHRWMETDQVNNRQNFFVVSVNPSKRGMTVRFGRTVFQPDNKLRNTLLNPNDPTDANLIEEHFKTAEKRFNKVWKNSNYQDHFNLPTPVWNPNNKMHGAYSRSKEDLKNNYETLMSQPLNFNDLNWDKNAPNLSVWKEELMARMRSYMVTHPYPTRSASTPQSLNSGQNCC